MTVGELIDELKKHKVTDEIHFITTDEDGNEYELDFVDVETFGRNTIIVTREKE